MRYLKLLFMYVKKRALWTVFYDPGERGGEMKEKIVLYKKRKRGKQEFEGREKLNTMG